MDALQSLKSSLHLSDDVFLDVADSILVLLHAKLRLLDRADFRWVIALLMRFVTAKPMQANTSFTFSLPLLMDIAFVLGEDYRYALRRVFASIQLPSKEDCTEALELFVETLHRAQRRFEKGGKTATAESPNTPENRDRMLYTLMDQTTRTWSSLVALWPDMSLAEWCLACEDFTLTLQSAYDGLLVPELNGSAVISADEWKLLKVVVLTLLYRVLDGVFRLEETKQLLQNEAATLNSDSMNELHGRMEKLCDVLAPLLEQHSGSAEGKLRALETASFVADLDAVYNMSHIFELYIVVQVDQGTSNELTESRDLSRMELTLASLHYLAEHVDRSLTDHIFHGSIQEARPELAKVQVSAAFEDLRQIRTSEDLEYVARSSLISQVQELFPDLGDGFIDACLIHFDGEAERLISALCEGQLPAELEALDRDMPRLKQQRQSPSPIEKVTSAMQRMSVERRNVHDFDAFDVYHGAQLAPGQVHRGKKDSGNILDQRPVDFSAMKSTIVSNYEKLYDDEYDDSYDVDDSAAGVHEATIEDEEEVKDPVALASPMLMEAYTANAAVFDRQARKTTAREDLKRRTLLSDEQIEGWRFIFERNPKKDQLLESHALTPNDNHAQPVSTFSQNSSRGRGRGRGRGRASQRRKGGHDRKMAKGMGNFQG